jgi:5-methylcytosine-specific restriction enzyme B
MNLVERQQRFLDAVQKTFGTAKAPRELFGVSNSAKVIEGGIQLGVVNLENVRDDSDALAFACVMRFPPEDEVYFAVLIRKDKAKLLQRLGDMKRLGTGVRDEEGESAGPEDVDGATAGAIKYRASNNNVPVYLAQDGRIWLRNKGFWDSLDFDKTPLGPPIEPDQIAVALYPPTASARRSLLAREFIGWLGGLVGKQKIHEIVVWPDAAVVRPSMRRHPASISLEEIESAVVRLGGYYPNGELSRLHTALNFLAHKHFVILSGLSGTGKTQLALKYARAVHGLGEGDSDPFLFVCPVRPEWTDPTGLTGYFDVLTNRYVVPPFLEALLVATAHRESPVFVILDELNLARVEYFLSDVLSCIETRGALQLHSNGVPLEGTTGTSIRAELALPSNLYIIGTINVDETTNPLSDKVLDRASVIEMSEINVPGFVAGLQQRFPDLVAACSAIAPKLMEIHALLSEHGFGFGYRVVEECIRYQAFDTEHVKSTSNAVTDHLLLQKVLIKLRGSDRQRTLLTSIEKACVEYPRSLAFTRKLARELDEYGSFQAMR